MLHTRYSATTRRNVDTNSSTSTPQMVCAPPPKLQSAVELREELQRRLDIHNELSGAPKASGATQEAEASSQKNFALPGMVPVFMNDNNELEPPHSFPGSEMDVVQTRPLPPGATSITTTDPMKSVSWGPHTYIAVSAEVMETVLRYHRHDKAR